MMYNNIILIRGFWRNSLEISDLLAGHPCSKPWRTSKLKEAQRTASAGPMFYKRRTMTWGIAEQLV